MLNSLEGFGFTDSFGKYMKGTMKFRSMVINGSNRSRGATWGKRYVTGITLLRYDHTRYVGQFVVMPRGSLCVKVWPTRIFQINIQIYYN